MLERHRGALFGLALDRVGRPEVAEEIAQQAIVRAWEHRSELRDPKAAGPWLFRITLNCCVEWQRREGQRWSSLEDRAERRLPAPPVLDEVLRRDTIRETRRALADVPFKNRVALLMHLRGYAYDEIGQFVGVPVSTVRGRVARARAQLRRDLVRRLGLSLAGKERGTNERV